MKKQILSCFISFLLVLLSASLVLAAEVGQGKCIKYEKESMLITMEEYDINFSKEYPYGRPTGVKSVYTAAKAEIGIDPKPGDILRIAYEVKGTERVAIKVMNVTQQDLMKK
jgi:hypothetical protein